MADVRAQVKVSGPVFDGRALGELDAFIDAAEEAVAQQGVNQVLSVLGSSLRNPTGFYESKIRTEHVQDDVVVNDSGVVYGPWLEGTGSRNQTTSFKGYRHFRRSTQQLQAMVTRIVEPVLSRVLARLNS